jgi:hypothetical protein
MRKQEAGEMYPKHYSQFDRLFVIYFKFISRRLLASPCCSSPSTFPSNRFPPPPSAFPCAASRKSISGFAIILAQELVAFANFTFNVGFRFGLTDVECKILVQEILAYHVLALLIRSGSKWKGFTPNLPFFPLLAFELLTHT